MPTPNARTKTDASWENAPALNKLTASQQGGSRGAQLWGAQSNGKLNTIYQKTPGGSWSPWMGSDWAGPGNPAQVYELAAAQQNNGCVQFWALDMKLQLWTTGQTSPGGNWTPWSGPDWNKAPKGMKRIAASQQGGSRGAQLWAITEDYSLITCYQLTAGGNWSYSCYDHVRCIHLLLGSRQTICGSCCGRLRRCRHPVPATRYGARRRY